MRKTKEQLIQEINQKKQELELLEKESLNNSRSSAIKELSEFTDKDKIAKFDTLYKSALHMLNEVEKNGYIPKDSEHYSWEEVMELLARDKGKFWTYYNSIDK